MMHWTIHFILILICIYLFRKINQSRKLLQSSSQENTDLLKQSEKLLEDNRKLREALQRTYASVLDTIPAASEIKKAILISKDDMSKITEALQNANGNIVSHFTEIVKQINDTIFRVMSQVEETQKNLVSESNESARLINDTDLKIRQADFVNAVTNRSERLLQKIIDELKLTHSREKNDIFKLDGIYQNVLKIQGLSEEVSEIAAGIELISLNASIEAAKAGLQGRSFAVVAREVSKMAMMSENTAKKIKTELKNTSDSIRLSVSALKDAMKEETGYIESTILIIKDVFQSIMQSLIDMNKTLHISMGSSEEIRKEVEKAIHSLQLEHISTYLAADMMRAFETVLINVSLIHELIPEMKKIEEESLIIPKFFSDDFESLDHTAKSSLTSDIKPQSAEDVTFF